jgi:hypothetical protein
MRIKAAAKAKDRAIRACLKNIPGDLAAGQADWLCCSPVTDFSRICSLVAPSHPACRARNFATGLFFIQALRNFMGISIRKSGAMGNRHFWVGRTEMPENEALFRFEMVYYLLFQGLHGQSIGLQIFRTATTFIAASMAVAGGPGCPVSSGIYPVSGAGYAAGA